MNEFRTIVRITPSPRPIGLQSRVITVGSCFADAIGGRLERFKFQSMVNPFGVIYNPVSIHKTIRYSIDNELPPEHTYLNHRGINFNYDFHSALSAVDKRKLSEDISNRIGMAHHFLKNADWLFITYGTAWIYARNDTGEVVANCHKMPSSTFTKTLLQPDEIVNSFKVMYDSLTAFNPNIRIILTLSPVRHIKDTIELNSVSKSILRMVCHILPERFKQVEYFPAYEMMMDDLRDYRFYKSDMLHPSEDAEEYIWDNFAFRYFPEDTKNFLKQWKGILSALAHKPFHPESPGHQEFLKETLSKLKQLASFTNIDKEAAMLESQLNSHNM